MEHVPYPCALDGEGLLPHYFISCGYYWPVFLDKGAFVCNELHYCTFRRELDCDCLEDAEAEAARWNREQRICPVCGHKGKFRGMTNFDLDNEAQLFRSLARGAMQGR